MEISTFYENGILFLVEQSDNLGDNFRKTCAAMGSKERDGETDQLSQRTDHNPNLRVNREG